MKNQSRLVCGVGINDADYTVNQKCPDTGKRLICPYYTKWHNMMKRCYSHAVHVKQPTYINCEVIEEWRVFSKFKSWMETQDWEDKQLDKDLLFPDNKIYSPDTCVFVSHMVNSFMLDSGAIRGEFMIGVCWNTHHKKYMSLCSDPFIKKNKHLGYYHNELDAHLAWKKHKHSIAIKLAKLETDPRIIEALTTRYCQ